MYKITFDMTVSMDQEQRLAGNSTTVKGITMTFTDEQVEKALERAVASERIAIQANIKAHWDDFVKAIQEGTFPKELNFGDRPFSKAAARVKYTPENAIAFFNAEIAAGRMTVADVMAKLSAAE